MRSLFVAIHKPRIASDVSGQYRRHPPLDPDWPLLHHWPAIQPTAYCTTDRTTAKRVLTGCPPKLMSVIGTKRTCRSGRSMSVLGGKATREELGRDLAARTLPQPAPNSPHVAL